MNADENRELQLAREFIEDTGSHLFLTGKAGTGKTTFLKNLKETSAKRMIITAPTGVAAINAGGVTLHSFFQLPLGPFIPGGEAFIKNKERLFRFSREKKQIIQSLDLLVIDEISMVRADVLDAVDAVLKYHRRPRQPFGGVQLLVIGDLHQLPPVAQPNEWELLKPYYAGIYFFNSLVLSDVDLTTIELKKVYRQSDGRFIRLLNKVRDDCLDAGCTEELNQRYIENFTPAENQGYIVLTTHNRKADDINTAKLRALKGDAYNLDAEISGDFPEHGYPTFARLTLKKGAQVMFLKNDSSVRKQFYNGKIGEITAITTREIHVRCPGEPEEIAVEPTEWENIKYSVDQEHREISEEVLGRFKQFPLKPAWAITIHKSQGLTFDRAVIDARAAFAQGQFYVALSRCKTFEGMVLSSPVPERGIKTDDAVTQFFKTMGQQNNQLADRLEEAKIVYQQQLLISCFDFQLLNNRLRYLHRLLSGNTGLVQISGITDMNRILESAHEHIFIISEKFKQQLRSCFPEKSPPVPDAYIQERTRKASHWFRNKFSLIFDDLMEKLIVETDNKALGKKIKNAVNNLKKEIIVKLAGIKSCQNEFLPSAYLRAVSKAEIEFTPGKPDKSPAPSYEASDIEHPELFNLLREWRLNLSKERGVPAFQILHQKVLIHIVVSLPDTTGDLEKIKGVGPKTLANYGGDIVAMVVAYKKKHDI